MAIRNTYSKSPRRALIIFTSDPAKEARRKQLDQSVEKSRLIYRAFLRHLLNIARSAQSQMPFELVFVSDAGDQKNIHRAVEVFPDLPPVHFISHRGESFGKKIQHALSATFSIGYDQVAIIGNDCLDLTPEILAQTFAALETRETVLGPAKDGGFYLLGLRRFDARLFENVQWCGAQVSDQISANIGQMHRSLAILPTLKDIDSYRDLFNWLCQTQTANRWLIRYLRHLLLQTGFRQIFIPPVIRRRQLSRWKWQLPPPA